MAKPTTDTWEMGPPSAPPDISGLNETNPVEAMATWFLNNFEDAAESTPFDEGEYVYIWGGPYDALEEIDGIFGGVTSNEAVAAAVEHVEEDGTIAWAPSQSRMRPER